MFIFITSHLSFEYHGTYYTNTGSNQITGMYWPHTKSLYHNKLSQICHQWHSTLCKMLYQKLGAPHSSTRQLAIWMTTTFRVCAGLTKQGIAIYKFFGRTYFIILLLGIYLLSHNKVTVNKIFLMTNWLFKMIQMLTCSLCIS